MARDILPYNYLKQAQFNAVVLYQKEMDRVGVEPTTSALFSLSIGAADEGELNWSNPTRSAFFFACYIIWNCQARF